MLGPSSSDLESLIKVQEQLEQEEEATIAKLLQLQKQRQFFKSCAKDLICCSLKSIDELDAAKENERKEKEQVATKQLTRSKNSVNFLMPILDLLFYSSV